MSTLTRIRVCVVVVIVGLVISGVTAFPLEWELSLVSGVLHAEWLPFPDAWVGLTEWIERVHGGLAATNDAYPFLAYGTDWLAFAHLAIAVAFIGPLRDPLRNIWVLQWGLIMCAGIVPLALIAGAVRGIPWGWQLIDMSFGVVAAVPLIAAVALTGRLEGERERGVAHPVQMRDASKAGQVISGR